MTRDTTASTKTDRRPVDKIKLRGWAKKVNDDLQSLKARVEMLEIEAEPAYGYIPFEPIRREPAWAPEVRERRQQLCQVQNWTYAGESEEGRQLLVSLETGVVEAGFVYLALCAQAFHDEKPLLGEFEEWISQFRKNPVHRDAS